MYVGRSVGLSRFIILSGSLIETVWGGGEERGRGWLALLALAAVGWIQGYWGREEWSSLSAHAPFLHTLCIFIQNNV